MVGITQVQRSPKQEDLFGEWDFVPCKMLSFLVKERTDEVVHLYLRLHNEI